MEMEDILFNLEKLKISALTKYKRICEEKAKCDILEHHNSVSNINANAIHEESKTNDITRIKVGQKTNELRRFSQVCPKTRIMLQKLETQKRIVRMKKVQDRIETLEEFDRKQDEKRRAHFLKLEQDMLNEKSKEEKIISQLMNECNKKNDYEHAKLVSLFQKHRQRQEIFEADRQRQNKNLERMKKGQQEFRLIYEQILFLLKKHNDDEMKNYLGDDLKVLSSLREQFEETLTKCKNGNATEEDVDKACNIHKLTNLRTKIEMTAEKINYKKQQEIQQKVTVVETSTPQHNQTIENKQIQKTAEQKKPEILTITRYISVNNLKMYVDITEFLNKHSASFKELERDATTKQFKFDCKKAVNLPVNSLSGINSEHIRDKYNRLYSLLKGQDTIVGDKTINASHHPQGIAFCIDLLAKKFVLQADLMVSSNPESAFCYATVAVSLWNEFPTFGKILLAYLYTSCPYLVPYYIPRQVGETDEEFYTKQGYQYSNGSIEKQDKFLKRMTGIMRLYAAMLIVKPKRGQNKTPINLDRGWNWISSLLKLEPQVDITATMLHTFLEITGFEMEARYGKIFQKLIRRVVMDNFLLHLRKKCTGGAATRLELLLMEYVKNGGFEQPVGYLGHSYW